MKVGTWRKREVCGSVFVDNVKYKVVGKCKVVRYATFSPLHVATIIFKINLVQSMGEMSSSDMGG